MQSHPSHPHAFPPTQWSVLISARASDSRERSRALEQICNTYWHPIYAYTRKRGFGSQDAEDITQAFFAHLLETDEFTKMREEKGKLRTFLLVAVRNFMAADWRRQSAQKRGGRVQVLSIDVEAAEDQTCLEPADNLTPEIVFERHWASTMLHTVMGRLQRAFEDLREQCKDIDPHNSSTRLRRAFIHLRPSGLRCRRPARRPLRGPGRVPALNSTTNLTINNKPPTYS